MSHTHPNIANISDSITSLASDLLQTSVKEDIFFLVYSFSSSIDLFGSFSYLITLLLITWFLMISIEL